MPRAIWWALALSVALHAATLPGFFRWHDAPPPPAAEIASVELLIQRAEPAVAPIGAAIAPAEPATLSVPQPLPEPVATPEPALDPEPPAHETDTPETVAKPALSPEPLLAQPAEPLPAPMAERLATSAAEPAVRRPRQPFAKPHPAHQQAQAAPPPTTAPTSAPTSAPATTAQTPVSVRPESPPRTDPAWLAGVGQWLLAHRSYPERARRQAQQGTVVVRIAVDPDGRVLDVSLVSGSGSVLLDQAAQALVRDAQLPPFPPDMKLARQSITLPIRYQLE